MTSDVSVFDLNILWLKNAIFTAVEYAFVHIVGVSFADNQVIFYTCQ